MGELIPPLDISLGRLSKAVERSRFSPPSLVLASTPLECTVKSWKNSRDTLLKFTPGKSFFKNIGIFLRLPILSGSSVSSFHRELVLASSCKPSELLTAVGSAT